MTVLTPDQIPLLIDMKNRVNKIRILFHHITYFNSSNSVSSIINFAQGSQYTSHVEMSSRNRMTKSNRNVFISHFPLSVILILVFTHNLIHVKTDHLLVKLLHSICSIYTYIWWEVYRKVHFDQAKFGLKWNLWRLDDHITNTSTLSILNMNTISGWDHCMIL